MPDDLMHKTTDEDDRRWLLHIAEHYIPRGWLINGYMAGRLTARGWIVAECVFGESYRPEITAAGRQEIANGQKQETTDGNARTAAEADARLYGVGFLRIRPNGSLERVDPRRVILKPEEKPNAE